MNALKSAGFVVVAQISKILVGLALIKLAAIYVGVEGFGQLGHLMSLITMLTMLAGGGIVNGLIKYTSEYRSNIKNVLEFVSAAYTYSLVVSALFFLVLIAFSTQISLFIFSSPGYEWVIRLLAVTQVCIAFSNVVIGVANGYKETKVYALIQVVGNVLSVFIIWWLISSFALMGAAFSIAIGFSFIAIPAFYVFYNSKFWGRVHIRFSFKEPYFRRLFGFTLMLFVSAMSFPLMEMFVRQMIIDNSGYADAGLWQALIKLSAVYVGFFGLFFAYYFIPMVSPMEDKNEIKKYTKKYLFITGCVFSLFAVLLLLLSDSLLPLFLSDEFLGLKPYLKYQLLGDFFKVLAYVIGFVFVAKAAVKIYIVAELFQNGLFVMLAYMFYAQDHTLEAILSAYVITYFTYIAVSIVTLVFYLKLNRFKNA